MITAVLLAAGRSKRFGSDKLLHEVNGRPLIYYSLRACVHSTLASIIVVVERSGDLTPNLVKSLFPDNKRIHVIENPHPTRGQMSSVKVGMRALKPEVDGAMIVLADMPLISSALIDELIGAFGECGTVVVPESDGTQYHPKIIPRCLFQRFLGLRDNARGTEVLGALDGGIRTVPVSDPSIFRDIDKPSDLLDLAIPFSLGR